MGDALNLSLRAETCYATAYQLTDRSRIYGQRPITPPA